MKIKYYAQYFTKLKCGTPQFRIFFATAKAQQATNSKSLISFATSKTYSKF